MLRNELRRGLKSPYPWLAFGCAILLYAISFTDVEWLNIIRYHRQTVVDLHNGFLMEFNPFRSLLPFCTSLPMCMTLAEDWEHGFCGRVITRTAWYRYGNARFMSSGILGGSVLVCALLIYLIFVHCFVPLWVEDSYYEAFIYPVLQRNSFMLYVVYFASLQFIFGFSVAAIGNVVATLTNTRSVILLATTLFFSALESTTNITLVGLSGAQSSIVFRFFYQTPLAVWCLIAAIFTLITTIAYLFYRKLLQRRLYT